MPRFAANLSMMYTEHDFLDRFAAASADGFQAVEYLFPYAYDAAELRRRLDDHGLVQVLFNSTHLQERGSPESAGWRRCPDVRRRCVPGWTGRWSTRGSWPALGCT